MGLPYRLRLRRTGDYRRVQGKGRRVRQPDLLAMVLPSESSDNRVGLTVSRKVGGAVRRNKVKRWLRESIRQQEFILSGSGPWDVVLIAHPSAANSSFSGLSRQVDRIFSRIAASKR